MYDELKRINQRPEPYQYYTAEILWNDEHISKQMLAFHLNEDNDPASRNKIFVDKSIDWIAMRFNIGPATSIADFGCGPGLYAYRFAEMGAAVTGIDFSKRSIAYAKDVARQKGLSIDYEQENYLTYQTDKKFDLITLIYCDFCPLSGLQRKALLDKFHQYLTPDGLLFLDVVSLNAFNQRQELTDYGHLFADGFWSKNDYFGFMNTFKYNQEKVIVDKYTIIEKSRTFKVYNWLQYYSRKSLAKEFNAGGFEIIEYYSDVAGAPYRADSDEIAVVAKKK